MSSEGLRLSAAYGFGRIGGCLIGCGLCFGFVAAMTLFVYPNPQGNDMTGPWEMLGYAILMCIGGFALARIGAKIEFHQPIFSWNKDQEPKATPGLLYCPRCLVKISEDTKYCPACGSDLKPSNSALNDLYGNKPKVNGKGLWTWAAICCILGIIGIVGSMYCFPGVFPYTIFPSDTTWSYTNSTLPETPGYATIMVFSDSGPVSCENLRHQTTDKIYIPSDTWEIVYTIDPIIPDPPAAAKCVRNPYMGISANSNDAAASYLLDWTSTPNLNPDQWKMNGLDSRLWVKQYNSGRGHYAFWIDSSSINSYTIEIRVPTNS